MLEVLPIVLPEQVLGQEDRHDGIPLGQPELQASERYFALMVAVLVRR
jgi:hypothetical protein